MRRSKRSTDFVMLKSCTSTSRYWLFALCSITLFSGCSSNSSGKTDRSDSVIVVSADNTNDQNDSNIGSSNSISATSANTTNSVQDDVGTEQHSQSPANDTAQPLSNDVNTNQTVSSNVLGGLPPDCIFDVSQSNVTFCYQAKTRMLRAWLSNGEQWWAYALPGDNATNDIHALQVVNENVYIVTELKTSGVQSGFEISKFALGGAFKKTVALNKFQDYSFISGHRIQVADIDDNLIIVGDYGLSANNILPNQFNGTFIAVFNTTTDEIVKSYLYPQLRQTNPMQINGDAIKLELEHMVYEVSQSNLELKVPVSRFQSIPFTRTNHHQKKHSAIGFIEKPPFEELHAQMDTAFLNALQIKRQADPDAANDGLIDCAGGGTVQQSIVVDNFDSEVQTTTFDNCSMAEFSAHGVLLQRQTNSCGQNCDGLNKTLRALAFELTYSSGEHWSIDGYISTKETRHSFSQNTGVIEDPETVYANLTEINVFFMSDDQITIDLSPGRYQYDGTLKSGTSTWVGSGTVNYATGVIESFSVDLSRQLLNGNQSDFSGQMDAHRSDGTALFVGVDTLDSSSVRYTTTSAGESVQTSSTW